MNQSGNFAFPLRFLVVISLLTLTNPKASAQRFLSDIDSSFFIRDTLRPLVKRFENLRITGYIQPQFQVAAAKGAPSYNGGNFSTYSNSRFMLRRARVKIDYLMPSKHKYPNALFSFQFDATERGVVVRDMFLKLFESKKGQWSATAGIFARPFGYEVNLSSAYRETPERGRMSQILMPSERDLGLMASFEPQNKKRLSSHFKLDLGIFNGQGLSGTTDFDAHKDVISRLTIKAFRKGNWEASGGLSFLHGGWLNGTKYLYNMSKNGAGEAIFAVDSLPSNQFSIAPRRYRGADIQIKWKHSWGETEWRAEYWSGTQPGTSVTSSNPGGIPTINGVSAPTFLRPFNGAFLLFLQHLGSTRHQLMLKYDWYDPNSRVKGLTIGKSGLNFNAADIKYTTTGLGYGYQLNPQTRLSLYYEWVRNEKTALAAYANDVADNIFTARVHFRF